MLQRRSLASRRPGNFPAESKRVMVVKYIAVGADFRFDQLVEEMTFLESVNHPCVLKTIGWSAANEECAEPRIATEFMSNGSLEAVLNRVKRGEVPSFWTHNNITKMMIGVLLGMKYLHSKDIIHRDLKPGNILLDEKGQIRIADFGTAKLEEFGTTTTASVIGTLAYMATETLEGRQATKKSDVFAFGLVAYEVLVGESVFPKTDNILQIAQMHTQETRPNIPKEIDPLIANVIRMCWSKDPEGRPTFEELFTILNNCQFPFFADVDYSECERFIAEVKAEESRKR
jgi:serine/threonine protein kinase